MSTALDQLAEEFAQAVFEKLKPKFRAWLAELAQAKPADPLLTCLEIQEQLRIGEQKVRDLVKDGYLRRAPGFIELRVRQSVVDAYGKPGGKK